MRMDESRSYFTDPTHAAPSSFPRARMLSFALNFPTEKDLAAYNRFEIKPACVCPRPLTKLASFIRARFRHFVK